MTVEAKQIDEQIMGFATNPRPNKNPNKNNAPLDVALQNI